MYGRRDEKKPKTLEEKLAELPRKNEIVQRPKVECCNVCGKELFNLEGFTYVEWREPDDTPDEEGNVPLDKWKKVGGYDYANARQVSNKDHEHCIRIRQLEAANVINVDRMRKIEDVCMSLSMRVPPLDEVMRKKRPRLHRLLFKAGGYLHSFASKLQRETRDE